MPDIDLDFPRDIREVLIPRVHERYGADRSALVAAFPTYRAKRRGPRPRQGAGAAAGGDRAGGEAVGFHEPSARSSASVARRSAPARRQPRWRALLELAREAGPAPPRLPAPRRDGDLDPAADRRLPGRAGGDGGPADRAVGQGLLRRRRLPQDRPARAGDALGGRALRRPRSAASAASGSTSRGSRSTTPRSTGAIRAAETTGVFQIESRAQMQMLPRTQPETSTTSPSRSRWSGPGRSRAAPSIPISSAASASARTPATRSPTSTRASSRCWRRRSGRSSSRSR